MTVPDADTDYVAAEFEPQYYAEFVDTMPSMCNKVIAITGSTTGIGFIAAQTLAAKGAHVMLLNRASDRSVAAAAALMEACKDGGTVTPIDCDLHDFASVRQAATAVEEALNGSGLDVLANNAGVKYLKEAATKDGYDVVIQTNYLSHFLLSCLLLPALQRASTTAGEARIVNHSSCSRNDPTSPLDVKYMQQKVGELGGDEQGGRVERYHQSKLAICTFTFALQEKLAAAKSTIKAVCAHPGIAPTPLFTKIVENNSEVGGLATSLVAKGHAVEDATLPLLSCICNVDAESGDLYGPWLDSDDVLMLGTDKIRGPPAKLNAPETLSRDVAAQQMLWKASEAAVGQKFFP